MLTVGYPSHISRTSVLDVLGVAEELRKTVDPEIPQIENVICGTGRTAVTHRGLTVPIEHQLLELGADDFDLLVVPALGVFDAPDVDRVLARPAARKVKEFLTELGPKDRPRLAGACTGTFLLAEAGCLDDHRDHELVAIGVLCSTVPGGDT